MFIDDIERIDGREINEMLMGLSLTPSWHMTVLSLQLAVVVSFFSDFKIAAAFVANSYLYRSMTR